MRFRGKIDANQPEIVKALRRCGAMVHSTAGLGSGFPDVIVGYAGELHLLEIKDGSKPPSQQKLTKDEKIFHDRWQGYSVHVVGSIDEALTAVGVEEV